MKTNITFVLSQFVIGGNDTISPSASIRQGYSGFPFTKSRYLEERNFHNLAQEHSQNLVKPPSLIISKEGADDIDAFVENT